MSSLTNINSYFLTRRNQFENNIFARFWTSDPFAGLIEAKPYELEMGLTPTVVTATHEWVAIARDLRAARSWRGRWMAVAGPPGWRADGTGNTADALRADWLARTAAAE